MEIDITNSITQVQLADKKAFIMVRIPFEEGKILHEKKYLNTDKKVSVKLVIEIN